MTTLVKSFPGRITAQATQNDRVTLLFDWANKIRGHRGLSATVSPEASDRQTQPASHVAQAKWTRAHSSKLLIEAGYNNTYIGSLFKYQPDIPLATCRSAFVACPAGHGLRQHRQAGSDPGHAVERIDADGRGHRSRASAGHVARGGRVSVVRLRRAQPQGRDPESLGMAEGPATRHQRRHRAAVPQRRARPRYRS